jgi:hypothetical protein
MKNTQMERARKKAAQIMLLRTFDPKRLILLFLTGFALGIFLISMGWAATSSPHKKHPAKHSTTTSQRMRQRLSGAKAVAHHVSHKKGHKTVAHQARTPKHIASRRLTENAAPVNSRVYSQPEGLYKFKYPTGWQINARENAMIVKSPGDTGVFGIVRRPDDQPNEEAVAREFNASDRPSNLTQYPSKIAGMRATKVVGSKKDDPYTRMVEYYVQHPNGHQYYILMMAPQLEWARYSKSFGSMLGSLSLN